jgi:hypothetical protein
MPDAEDASWAALAAELETPDLTEEVSPPVGRSQTADNLETLAGDKPELPNEEKPQQLTPEQQQTRNLNAALKESRAREKAANDRLNQFTETIRSLRETRQPAAEPAPAPKKEPTVEEDPIGYFQNELAKRDQVIQQLQQGTQQSVQRVQQHQQQEQFWNVVKSSETAARASPEMADYDDACRHLEGMRVAQLAILYPDNDPNVQAYAARMGGTPEQLRAYLLDQDRVAVAQTALQFGRSPAVDYYNLAKQHGYAPKGAKGANGQRKPTVAEQQIEAARRGQGATKSLSGGGGKSEGPMSLTELEQLFVEDPDMADKVWKKMEAQGLLG